MLMSRSSSFFRFGFRFVVRLPDFAPIIPQMKILGVDNQRILLQLNFSFFDVKRKNIKEYIIK